MCEFFKNYHHKKQVSEGYFEEEQIDSGENAEDDKMPETAETEDDNWKPKELPDYIKLTKQVVDTFQL